MTFFGALGTAVSGVNAAATWVGHISDNVANATTNGYKEVNTAFSDLVHNKLLGDSPVIDSNKHGGVLASADFNNRKQGGLTQDESATSIAIRGNGFFPVQRPTSFEDDGTPVFGDTTVYYTRLGDFVRTQSNNLANSAGFYLQAADIGTTTPTLFTIDETPIDADLTTTIDFRANLSSNAVPGTAYSNRATVIADNGTDGLGVTQGLQMDWTKSATANEWSLSLTGGTTGQTSFGPITVTFADGTVAPFLAGRLQDMTTADAGLTVTAGADGAAASVSLSVDFGAGPQALTLNLGTFNGAFDPTELSGLTQFSDPSGRQSNVDISQNGLLGGEFTSISFRSLGEIDFNYTNSRSQVLSHVMLANFPEPDRLDRINDVAFLETSASGEVVLGTINDPDNAAGIGNLVPSALENSTVDVAEQMTFLIQAQQAYGLNSQVITAADEMLSRLIDLKR